MSGIFNIMMTDGSSSTALIVPGYANKGYSKVFSAAGTVHIRFYLDTTWIISSVGAPTSGWSGTPRTGNWASGVLFPGGYQIRATGVKQDNFGGSEAYDSGWISLTNAVEPVGALDADATYSYSFTGSISIRENGGSSYVETANIELNAIGPGV